MQGQRSAWKQQQQQRQVTATSGSSSDEELVPARARSKRSTDAGSAGPCAENVRRTSSRSSHRSASRPSSRHYRQSLALLTNSLDRSHPLSVMQQPVVWAPAAWSPCVTPGPWISWPPDALAQHPNPQAQRREERSCRRCSCHSRHSPSPSPAASYRSKVLAHLQLLISNFEWIFIYFCGRHHMKSLKYIYI